MSGIILMYHRVADEPRDAYGLAVTPDRFASHVDYLRRLGGVVPLLDMLRPSRAFQVAITFDDGYADNVETAAPILVQAGLPATYFITTGRLGGQHFWWDRLAVGLLGEYDKPPGVDVSVNGRNLWLALDTPQACFLSLQFAHRRLRPLPPDELLATVDTLLGVLKAPDPPHEARTMNTAQLTGLAGLPGVDVGAHTRTHLQLQDQSRRLQEEEVVGSVADLTAVLGRPITSFAYPFGSDGAVGSLAPGLTRQAGCLVACTTEPGPVVRRSDPHLLPRLNVRDWEVDQLASAIAAVAEPARARLLRTDLR